ncbi:MAG: PDDEXK nuclease domain-containing protein [Bacteroidota bacterium]|nr:PDDEXK nuclease domain-containing protein [Bacteroidota bacterium]
MKNKIANTDKNYKGLVSHISEIYIQGQEKATIAVNTHLVDTYWKIGQYIVEFEQKGKERAEYGTALLKELSKDLKLQHGKGFSLSNIKRMRQFYTEFPKSATLSHLLGWSHYVEILKINDKLEKGFYLQQSINEKWSVRELIRQKKSSLYLRLAASKDKEGILELSQKGQTIQKPEDIIREPYTLDFLKIPEIHQYSEKQLEDKIITHLKDFLLELGKGFAFIGRQYRVPVGNRPYAVDLVFYHRILKCFVLIDLKREEAGYEDVGQMNMYLGYFENEENTEGDNPPIGIVLAKEKDELLIQYTMHNVSSQLFVNKYQLYLPNKEELRKVIESQLNEENNG